MAFGVGSVFQESAKSGVSSSFLPEKMRNPVSEIRCQFIILARKDELTPDYAKR